MQLLVFSRLEKLKAKLDSLSVVVERAIVHQLQEIEAEVREGELHANEGGEGWDSMAYYIPGDFLEGEGGFFEVEAEPG